MEGKCSNPDCAAPISCHVGKDNHEKCEFWIKGDGAKPASKPLNKKNGKANVLPWKGEAFLVEDLSQVTIRNVPIIVGLIGRADAGKTTYLAMLYTLLLRGEVLNGYTFAGSKTILGWDRLYHKLKVQKDKVVFPDPTSSEYLRLLHLAFRDNKNRLKDIFLSDASGEVFRDWSRNREDSNAENARWVYKNAAAFVLFIDCADLIDRKNQAKTEIIDLAQMLRYDLQNRPVIAVWSKSDRNTEINPRIKESLQQELKDLFINYHEISISNFSVDDPDTLVHKNNIEVLNCILHSAYPVKKHDLFIENKVAKGDFFLHFNGEINE